MLPVPSLVATSSLLCFYPDQCFFFFTSLWQDKYLKELNFSEACVEPLFILLHLVTQLY